MNLGERLEQHQVIIYFTSVITAAAFASLVPGTRVLEAAINPALALMLFVTFLQVPLADLGSGFTRIRFMGVLLLSNFVLVPLWVAFLTPFLPPEPVLQLGVLFVLLTPCIDYVVTFSRIGRADARLLLACTPVLLIAQMLLLPVYLDMFLGDAAADLVQPEPFVTALLSLIALPLTLAALFQAWASRSMAGARTFAQLSLLPVPATALVLFIVVAAMVPQIGLAVDAALRVAPLYVVFAIVAPWLGWTLAGLFRLDAPARRAVAFSTATRNSLVVLPLALAVPGAMPVLPAIIVTQTLVELVASLIYMRVIAQLGGSRNQRSA